MLNSTSNLFRGRSHSELTTKTNARRRDLLDGLKKRGFRLNMGHNDCGLLPTVWERGGGYYLGNPINIFYRENSLIIDLDVGASQLIIDGKIKLKNDSVIARFTSTGIQFENGSEIPADVVIFATGCVHFIHNSRMSAYETHRQSIFLTMQSRRLERPSSPSGGQHGCRCV